MKAVKFRVRMLLFSISHVAMYIRIELRPTFNRFFECLDLGDVGDLLIEAAEGLVVIDVIRDVVHKIFEVHERALEIGFDCGDVLQGGSAV